MRSRSLRHQRKFKTLVVGILVLSALSTLHTVWAAQDQLQDDYRLDQCLYSELANVIAPSEFQFYSLDQLDRGSEGLTSQVLEESSAEGQEADNTTSLRLENRFWSSTDRIVATLKNLKARFPDLESRDQGIVVSHVRSDIYPTFHGTFYLDKQTGKLVMDGAKAASKNPDRFETKDVNFKLRVRKYEGSELTNGFSKVEIKFKSLVDGVVHKPSVLFDDKDVATLLRVNPPSAQQISDIRSRTLANPNNRTPDDVDQILEALPILRRYHKQAGIQFAPVVHLGYERSAQELKISRRSPSEAGGKTSGETFSLQFTHDYNVFAKAPEIVPRLLDTQAKPSDIIFGTTPEGISVLEVKRPLSKAGVNDKLKKKTRWFMKKVNDEFPDLKEADRILSPLVKSAAQKKDFKMNKGKRFAAGHDALAKPPDIRDEIDD